MMQQENQSTRRDVARVPEFRVAIVGGGPGGLFTAWNLAAKAGAACN